MKKRILSILLTLCMVLCLMPTAAFAEGNEDTPTQALTNVDITFPKPEEGKEVGDGSAASANADSGLTLYLFGPALWQQGSEPKKLKADDTYQKDSIYLLNFTFYTQKPITDETALTFNGNPITRYADYQALTEALNAYDGTQDAYLGLVMFSKDGTGDPSMEDLKDLYIVGLYAIIRAQEHTVEEQFNLDSGGTYYFDLSGESIPGTVNDSLPDKTMHYVPFTYAGTVDAYKLTSETATTEEYAQKNKYDHSLFVADYAVTKDVSRDALNTANLFSAKTTHPAAWTIRCVRRPWEVVVQVRVSPGASRHKTTNGIRCWTRTTNISKTGARCFRGDKILGVLLRRAVRSVGTTLPATGITTRPGIITSASVSAPSLKF